MDSRFQGQATQARLRYGCKNSSMILLFHNGGMNHADIPKSGCPTIPFMNMKAADFDFIGLVIYQSYKILIFLGRTEEGIHCNYLFMPAHLVVSYIKSHSQ